MADQNNGKSPSEVNAGDPLDERVRAALKVVDASTPAGYQELGAASVLARLDEAKTLPALPDLEKSMSNDTSSSVPTPIGSEISQVPMRAVVPAGAPPVVSRSSEDSGLHDLKNLAASAKNRITSRRTSTMPPIDDEALLSSASASFKAMALPEPARIVSLPNPGMLPALARAPKATQSELSVAATAHEVSAATPTYASKSKSNKNLFLIGGGVAAVAAAAAFFVMNKKGSNDDASAKAPATVAAVAPAPQRNEAVAAAPSPAPVPPPEAVAVADTAIAEAPTAPVATAAGVGTGGKSEKNNKDVKDVKDIKANQDGKDAKPVAEAKPGAKPDAKAVAATPVKTDGDAGSVDDLLKEAGVNVAAKEAKPTLDKKELTRDDIAAVMKGRTGAAQACLSKNGVAGTVGVKLSVAPSGKVSKAVATGPLAGTPTGDCVVNAVSGSTFPAWDGRPTTVIYSYLLSE